MGEAKIYYSFKIGNFPINITSDIVVQWVVILVLGITAYLLTRNLKRVPDKKQVVLETIYNYVENLVKSNMGESFMVYLPYVGTLVVYLLSLNLLGLIGVEPPTKSLSVTLGLGITSFLVINGTAIKRNGIGGYAKGLISPYALMLPLNILERVTLPISLALRLFGNMLAATLLVSLFYQGLSSLSFFAQIGLPIVAHAYFDLFDGTIQMLVFTMLTIVYIKIISDEH
ncbi:MAG: F0F1 ATP synthase subunit A [Clostridium sp.]|nr:F0F1 ATP synthase subunit A [Clostridium sp.]MCI7444040.1 F0F1 ATP synthase subunit A [Clostridium sp.]